MKRLEPLQPRSEYGETHRETEARIAADIRRGARCERCHLVLPCGGHEDIGQYATMRRGEGGRVQHRRDGAV